MTDAGLHLRTAEEAARLGDLAGAYQLAYDAGRKALSALLRKRGLRTKGEGAHATLITATGALGLPGTDAVPLDRFDRMRRTRNATEYGGREITTDEVVADLEIARTVVAFVEANIDSDES